MGLRALRIKPRAALQQRNLKGSFVLADQKARTQINDAVITDGHTEWMGGVMFDLEVGLPLSSVTLRAVVPGAIFRTVSVFSSICEPSLRRMTSRPPTVVAKVWASGFDR